MYPIKPFIQSLMNKPVSYLQITLALMCMVLSLMVSINTLYAQNDSHSKEETTDVAIIPGKKLAIFSKKNKAKYYVDVHNGYKTPQSGTISYQLTTDKGLIAGTGTTDVTIAAKSKKRIPFTIPVPEVGFYDATFYINLEEYDDTIRSVFGYRPFDIQLPDNTPYDFDDFWQKAKDDLQAVAPNYKVTKDSTMSTPSHKVYKVEMQSLDNVTVWAWLSIPRVRGNYPVIYGFGGYKIELPPGYSDDFVTFHINVRGIGNNAKIINPDNKEQFLLNIEDKNKYVYRGIYMDCLRGLDFLKDSAAMGFDTTRIAFVGGSQGATLALITAALSNKACFCIADNPAFCDFTTNYEIVAPRPEPTIPIKYMLEYFKNRPSISKAGMLNNLRYFEVQNFAPKVDCPVLLGAGLKDLMAPPTCTFGAFNKLRYPVKNKSEVYVFPSLGHEVTPLHNTYKSVWIYEHTVKKHKPL